MQTVLATILLAAGAAAAPAPAAASYAGGSGFTVMAARSASPIHLQPVAAAENAFWIGKDTATYCPLSASDCAAYTSNVTALACADSTGKATTCGLNTAVPGGQQVYVDPATGALGYTQAHSAATPEGALTTGFTYAPPATEGLGSFDFAQGCSGLVACPQGYGCNLETGAGCAPWKIYAALDGKDFSQCLGFDGLTSATTQTAWQYE